MVSKVLLLVCLGLLAVISLASEMEREERVAKAFLGFLRRDQQQDLDKKKCFGGCDWYCSGEVACPYARGDCDSDEECVGALRCGEENCLAMTQDTYNYDEEDDCCF